LTPNYLHNFNIREYHKVRIKVRTPTFLISRITRTALSSAASEACRDWRR
jgi:hypothetical protein